MACEALAALDLDELIDEWAIQFNRRSVPVPKGTGSLSGSEWRSAFGDYSRITDWIALFERSIEQEGWHTVVKEWVPRLMPSVTVALFHGAIRSVHATRAISARETAARRAELARALGFWAARADHAPEPDKGERPILPDRPREDSRNDVLCAAADARQYLARPNIRTLHGVTGAMAVHLLMAHLPPHAAADSVVYLGASHEALYRRPVPVLEIKEKDDRAKLVEASAEMGDPHQVKLVEACLRASEQIQDPAFIASALSVTGLRP